MKSYIQYTLLLVLSLVMLSCQNGEANESNTKAPKQTIHEAAFLGNAKVIQQHIDAGSDLNVKDQFGSTPLTIAITFDKTEVAKILINAGANIQATSADGSSPLHTAAFLGRIDVVKALLDKGADTEVTNAFGSTPIQSLQVPFENVKPVYDQLSKDLGPLGFKLNYDELQEKRPVIAQMLIER